MLIKKGKQATRGLGWANSSHFVEDQLNKATLCKYRLQDGELIEKDITNTLCLDDILPLYAMLYKDSSTIAFQDKKTWNILHKKRTPVAFQEENSGSISQTTNRPF